jgi:hypothetical protein
MMTASAPSVYVLPSFSSFSNLMCVFFSIRLSSYACRSTSAAQLPSALSCVRTISERASKGVMV